MNERMIDEMDWHRHYDTGIPRFARIVHAFASVTT